jgi:hypothetical protein
MNEKRSCRYAIRIAAGAATILGFALTTAPAPAFHLEEASIADIQRAIMAKEITARDIGPSCPATG